MNNGVLYRLLVVDDAQQYRNLRLRSYQESPFAFSESFEDESEKPIEAFEKELAILGNPPEWFVLGAFVEKDQLIGFVKFRRDLRSKARHKSMLHAMYVDPKFRGRGIGKQILLELFGLLKTMSGLEQVHLWVLHSAEGSSASVFYNKLGFQSQGPLIRHDLKIGEQYIDAEYMVLYLEGI